MLNKSAATDARHSRAGKDAMIYDPDGKALAQAESFTAKASFSNDTYTPLGQNGELENNNTIGVKIDISEIVVLDGYLFNQLMAAVTRGDSPVVTLTGVIEGRNGSEERVVYRECIFTGDSDIQNVSSGDVLKRAFSFHCNGEIENKKQLTI